MGYTSFMHLTAYRGTVTAATNNQPINIITSSGDVIQNNQYFPRDPGEFMWAVAFGTDLSNPRIVTPYLRDISPLYLRPFNVATPLGNDFNAVDFSQYPVKFRARENIDVQAGNSNVANQAETVLLGLRFGFRPVPRSGERRTILATGTTTLVANTWTNVPLTFADTLPDGLYEVVGMQAFSATGYAARLILPGEYYRPGVPMNQTIGQKYPANLRYDMWGSWGQFRQSALPSVEMLATAGDTAETVYLDVVKVG